MEIAREIVEKLGGLDTLRKRMEDFAQAVEAHRFTEGVPAPIEAEIIERLVKLKVAPEEVQEEPAPPPPPPPPAPRFLDSSAIVSRLMTPKFAAQVKAAVDSDVQMWAFWQRLLGRQHPIDTADPEFPQAWKSLESTIGKDEADTIFGEIMAERK